MTFRSLPLSIRTIKATEQNLDRIYRAARSGLKGDALALAAELLPIEYRRLCEFDPNASMAETKGRADLEQEMADVVINAARAGDAKAAMDLLKHRMDWKAAQVIQLNVVQEISIVDALAAAEQRLTIANDSDVTDVEPRMLPTKEKTA